MFDSSFINSVGSEIVTLVVGKNRQDVHVDKAILCKRSEHFRKMFSGQFKESSTLRVKLLEKEPQTIQFFVLRLYAGADTFKFPERRLINAREALNLHLLAQEWLILDLQTATFNRIRRGLPELANADRCVSLWYIVGDATIRFAVLTRYLQLMDEHVPRNDIESLSNSYHDDPQFLKDALVCRTVLARTRSSAIPISFTEFCELWNATS